jgi:hypothetical protein
MMRNAVIVLTALLLTTGGLSQASAQSAQAVKAAHDATLKARAITYTLRDENGAAFGNARLTTIGRTRSRIQLNFTSATTPRSVTLVRRADCRPSTAVLTGGPAATLARNGPLYDSVVDVPMSDLTSGNYSLRVQQANRQAVCTQLQ